MKTAAVWGASGFVGRHLVAALQQAGWRVRALVRETGSAAAASPQLESVALPFTAESAQMVAALAGADVVFHCAGNPEATAAELSEFESATTRFAEAVSASGAQRLIQLSTVAVYGAGSGQSIGPDSPLEGSGAYARGRIAAETAAIERLRGSGSHCVIVRVPMVVGPDMGSNALRWFFDTLNTGIFFHPGSRDAVLNCIGVTRLCRLLVALAENQTGQHDGVYQFADNITWREIADLYARQAARRVVRLRVPRSLARHVAALMLGRQRPDSLDVLGNTVIFRDASDRVVTDSRALPDTRDDITRLIDTLAASSDADKASLWKVVNLTVVNLFARVAAGILPFVAAWYFGATVITDALFWVFSAILFLGGAFSNALETVVVPWVSRKELESTGKRWLSSASIGIVLPALAGVGVFVVLNKWLLGSGYLLAAESAPLADTYIHQNAFVILFMMLSGLWSGVFLARARFLSPAVSLSLKWWGTLVVLVLLCENGAIGLLGYSFLSGEALRLALLAALIRGELWSSGVSWRSLAAATREMPWREFGFMFLTAVALHINPMVDRFMASWLGAGAVSLFEYGWTVYLLPAMIFTSGYLIIAYTRIAQSLARREIPQFRSQVADLNHHTWRYSFFAIVAVGIVAYAMVESGFGLGKLSPTHLAQVGAIAMALTAGLPFALFSVGYSRILIAMNRASAVLMISTVKIVLNLVGNLLLIGSLGLIGLAASTVIAEAVSASMSAWYAHRVMNSLSATRPRRARYG